FSVFEWHKPACKTVATSLQPIATDFQRGLVIVLHRFEPGIKPRQNNADSGNAGKQAFMPDQHQPQINQINLVLRVALTSWISVPCHTKPSKIGLNWKIIKTEC